MAAQTDPIPSCTLCPRMCGARRTANAGDGACFMGTLPVLARAGVHRWEEPCISGTRGSGTVFFCGCALGCVYCQNAQISRQGAGRAVSVARLREIYRELAAQGVHNINLVTPSHFAPAVAQSLSPTPPVPVVYNCSGYERVETLRLFRSKIQIYLPDLKYTRADAAARYSRAPDYPQTAKRAILEMFRQAGPYRMDAQGILQSGLMIRHLILPGRTDDALDVIDWVMDAFPRGSVLLSLMSQYVPHGDAARFPEINRPLSPEEYERVEQYLLCSGFEDGYIQDLASATDAYLPDFNLQGVERALPDGT